MPGSLDFNGMLAALQGAATPVRDPLDELAAAAEIARPRLRVFDPTATEERAPHPVAPRGRRSGR